MRKIAAVHSFGLGNAFIIRYTDGGKRNVRFEDTRKKAAVTRMIARPGWRVAMELGGYSAHVPPKC